jgi:hypothetical protein
VPAPQKVARLSLLGSARQFAILTQRYIELILRNRFSLFVLLAVMPIIGLLLLTIAQPFWLTGKYDPDCEKAGIASSASDWDAPDAIPRCIEYHLQHDIESFCSVFDESFNACFARFFDSFQYASASLENFHV